MIPPLFHHFCLPPAYVLTLAETPEREQAALRHLNDDLGFSAQPFYGFHGASMGLSSTKGVMTPGMIGCQLGHMALWKCLIASKHQAFLIFEDDVLLPQNAYSVMCKAYCLDLPKDWNVVYWGYCWANLNSRQEINASFDRVTWPPMCNHAYMIKKQAAAAVLPKLNCDAPIDVQTQKLFNEIGGVYIYTDPEFAKQHSLVYTSPGKVNVPVISADEGIFRSQTCERKSS